MLILSCLFLSLGFIVAQTNRVTGTVVDEAGEPIVSASVVVKGTTVGVVTDLDGKFSINVPEGRNTLVFTLVGMKSIEMRASQNMRVIMQSDDTMLDEVVIAVPYGTAKKSTFTGAASTVGATTIGKQQVSNVSKALEGSIPGVQLITASGQPGSAADIRIRGMGSFTADQQKALIVVDGVPYEGSLTAINNHDIENITVLKDASATTLYGSRGANGVVMITTKKGSVDKVRVQFENRTGFNTIGLNRYDYLKDPSEFYSLYWESRRNQIYHAGESDLLGAGMTASDLLSTELRYNNYDVPFGELIDPVTGRFNSNANLRYHDDWLDEVLRTGFRQENNLSISGGDAKTKYYASFNYLTEDSYIENSGLDRFTSRINLDHVANQWFKAGVNLAYSYWELDEIESGVDAASNIFNMAQKTAPIFPVYAYDSNGNKQYDSDGNVIYDWGDGMYGMPIRPGNPGNPIGQQRQNIQKRKYDNVSARIYAQADFLDDFSFTINGSIDNQNQDYTRFQTPLGGDALNVRGRSIRRTERVFSWNINQLLNWNRTFNEDHTFQVLLGHESKKDRNSRLQGEKENFLNPYNPELAGGALLTDATSWAYEYALEGYFSQLKYDYQNKYYFDASYRRDGSSNFHKDHRWGDFWSVGGSWRITQEEFMSNTQTWLNDLKLRVSYGTQGQDKTPYRQAYLRTLQQVGTDNKPALIPILRKFEELTWEKQKMFNIGLDFRIFDKLSATIEVYNKTNDDVLYAKTLAPSQGNPSFIYENSMATNNKGIEVELNYNIFNKKDFVWNFSVNGTHLKSKLTKLPPDRPQDGWVNGNYYLKKGTNRYNWYLYKYAGVDPANGDALYYKDILDKDGKVVEVTTVNTMSTATRYDLDKSPLADFIGGFSTNLTYRGFDFSVSAAFEIGGWALDNDYANLMSGGGIGNWHKDIFKRWTPDNPNTNIPRLHNGNIDINGGNSDRFLTSRTHMSLRNATLGYTLPTSLTRSLKLENLRFFAVGDNLFLISKRKGFDPRQSITGSGGGIYGMVRTVSFGFNVNF